MRITKSHNNKLTKLWINDKAIWFSYETPVAFWNGNKLIVSENEWGCTTGRHLNSIDGGGREEKEKRIPHEELLRILNKYVFRKTRIR